MPTRKQLTPQEDQAQLQERANRAHGYGAIRLVWFEGCAIVEVQVGELWVPVIEEDVGQIFDHTVEPSGIEQSIAEFFSKRQSLFEFTSERGWVNHAQGLFADAGHSSDDTICLDALGRIVEDGAGFQRAAQDQAYPVKVYSTKTGQ